MRARRQFPYAHWISAIIAIELEGAHPGLRALLDQSPTSFPDYRVLGSFDSRFGNRVLRLVRERTAPADRAEVDAQDEAIRSVEQ